MAYSNNAGDILTIARDRQPTMTMSVPLYAWRGELDPVTLWKTQPAIRTVVDFLANTQAGIPLNLYRALGDTDRERVRIGSVAKALKRPVTGVTSFNLRRDLLTDRHVHDRWVVFKATGPTGQLELHRIPAALTQVVATSLGQPTAIRVGFPTGGGTYDLPLNEVIFDCGYTPDVGDGLTIGHSVLHTMRDLAEEMQSAGEYRRDLWKNGAQIPGYITRPATAPSNGWGPDSRKRFIDDFEKYKIGGGRAGGMPLLEDGMEIKKAEVFTPADTEFIEVRKLALAEAAAAMRVPPELVGAREGNYSNLDAYREQLYQDVLGPHIMAFEEAFDMGLAPEMNDDEYIEANVDVKLRASFTERVKAIQTTVGAPYRTRNEARAMENLPAVEGGDELVTPLNVLIGGQASASDSDPDKVRYDAPADGSATEESEEEPDPKARRPQQRAAGSKSDDLATVAIEAAALTRHLEAYWARQAARLESNLELQKSRKALPAIDELLNWDSEAAELQRILRGSSQRVAEAAAWEILTQYNPEADGWAADALTAWLAKAATTNAADWIAGLRDRLVNLVTTPGWEEETSRITGWTIAGLFAVGWATQYASFGRHDAARASGLGTKTWRTTSKKPRATHAALNGETVRIDDIFGNGLRYPGDPQAGAAEAANCACRLEYSR